MLRWHFQSGRNNQEPVATLGGLRTYLATGPDARPPPHPSHFDPVDTVERNLSESIGRHARPDCDPNHEYRDRLYDYRYSDTIRLRRSRHSRIPTPITDLTHDLLIKPLMRGYANDSHGLALGSMDYDRSSLRVGFPERTTSLAVCINTGNDAHLVQQCFVDRTWLKSATTGTPRILPFRSILVGYSAVLLNRAASAWPRYKRNRGLKDSNPAQICLPNLESHSSLVRAGHYRNICGCSASARLEHICTPERKRR